jgi:D-glycero-D-manno-heptose 1,7-bisphosphate phosphatase
MLEVNALARLVPTYDAAARRRPALLLDRDGVLNIDTGYVGNYADFRWIPGALEALAVFARANWHICVVTNQSGIARGYFSAEDVERLHREIAADVCRAGGRIDAFFYCPFHPESRIEDYRVADHIDRKPNPGMLFKALHQCRADAHFSIMIGDKPTDIEAGHRAGVDSYRFPGGRLDEFLAGVMRARIAKITALR